MIPCLDHFPRQPYLSLSTPSLPSSNNTVHFRSWGLDLLGNLFLLCGLGLPVINIIE